MRPAAQTSTADPARAPGPLEAQPRARRAYLDWLRGLAVLVMIEGHVLDAWTRPADREALFYAYSVIVFGMGGPLFLFLAGISAVLAAAARSARLGEAGAAASVRRRGWQIFLYALLFRLQSFVLSPGASAWSLLRVDILNIMGPAIVMAATLWQWGRTHAGRVLAIGATVVIMALATPVIRSTPLLDPVPDPFEWYLRPHPGRTNFTLFPWSGFLLAGAAAGTFLQRTPPGRSERRVVWTVGAVGLLVAAAGYGASLLPSIYAESSFWTSSPTFFFLRAGLLLTLLPLAWAWERRPWRLVAWSPLVTLGVESLFVYWIHVEIVYGALTRPLHRQLPLAAALAGFGAFTMVMLAAVLLKMRLTASWREGKSGRGAEKRLRLGERGR